MTNYTAPLNGPDIYDRIKALAPKEGSKVRITVPGWTKQINATVSYHNEQGHTVLVPGVYFGATFLFLGDRANGHHVGTHDWKLEFEVPEPTAWEKFLSLSVGDKFTLSTKMYTYVKVSPTQFASLSEYQTNVWDYKQGMWEITDFEVVP